MAKLSNIIIHCSDSEFGSATEIRRWHLANGWKDIGYHFVIMNGLSVPDAKYQKKLYLPSLDGSIEVGRRLDGDGMITDNEVGAHALGYNAKSIGICLIGVKTFTVKQYYSLAMLVFELQLKFNIPMENVLGHYQVCANKTCPNFDVNKFKLDIKTIVDTPSANAYIWLCQQNFARVV